MPGPPTAIVTGSSRGIGRAIAIALGQAGYAVVVNAARNLNAADEVVREIESSGGRAISVLASIAESAGRQRLLAAARDQLGEVQVLVNNAGIASPGRLDLLDATEENWELVFATNLKGPFFLTQQTARQMIAARRQVASTMLRS